jgi:hypothetical protein
MIKLSRICYVFLALLFAAYLSICFRESVPTAQANGVTVVTPAQNTPWISFWGRWSDPALSLFGPLGATSTEGAGSYFVVQFSGANTLTMDISNSSSKAFYYKLFPATSGVIYPSYVSLGSNGIWNLQLPSTGTYTVVIYAIVPNNTWTPVTGSGAYLWTLNSLSINAGTFMNVTYLNNPDYSIEYIGASITAGGDGGGYDSSFTTQSAQYLVANYSPSIGYSNFGIYGRAMTVPSCSNSTFAVNCNQDIYNNGSNGTGGTTFEYDWDGVRSANWKGTKSPNVIVVDFGTNDATKNVADITYQTAMVDYLSIIIGAYPSAHIFVLAPFQCNAPGVNCSLIYPNYSNDIKTAIDIAIHTGNHRSSHIHFVDTSPNNVPWLVPCNSAGYSSDYGSDCLHPNSYGAQKAGRLLANRLAQDFTGGGTIKDDKGFYSAAYGYN